MLCICEYVARLSNNTHTHTHQALLPQIGDVELSVSWKVRH